MINRRHSVVAFAAALVLMAVPTALAGKGGNGNDSTGGAPATLSVAPNPAPAWGAAFQGTGCGYAVGTQANVVIADASSQVFFPVGVDASGCIAFTYWTGAPGVTSVKVFQNAKGNRQSLKASATLTVV